MLNKHSKLDARVRGWLGGCSVSILALASAAALGVSPASAQEDEGGGIETMIVTAQFREQEIQKTPLAITAVSSETLEERGMTNLEEVEFMAPNVGLGRPTQAFGNILVAGIRGFAYGDYTVAQEPAVGYYVDDVYYATMPGSLFRLVDLDRIEILRGPQGTLAGKNTIGGAIKLISKKPQGDGSGYVEATYGRFDRLDLRGTIDVPIIEDRLMVRVTGMSNERDGYQRNIDFACAFQGTGLAGTLPIAAPPPSCDIGTFGGEDIVAGRASIRAVISPDIELNVYADVVRDKSEIQADTLIGVDIGDGFTYLFQDGVQGGTAIPRPSDYPGAFAVCYASLGGVCFDRRFLPADMDVNYANYTSARGVQFDKRQTMDAWGTQGTLDWNILDNLHFKSMTAYRTYDIALPNDDDASPIAAVNTLATFIKQEQFSQEGRFTGELFNDRLRWTVGGYYLRWAYHQKGPVIIEFGDFEFPAGTFNPLTLFAFQQNDKAIGQHYSGYAHTEFDVTDALEVFAGYRYSHETKSYRFNHFDAVPGYAGCFSPPNVAGTCNYVSIAEPSFFKFNISDWRAGMKYDIADNVRVYGQVSTGYRGSGLQTRPFTEFQFTTGAFGPERVKSYEVGLRSEWFDNRVIFNATAFYADYYNRQVPVVGQEIVGGIPIPFTRTDNVGRGIVEGIELELQVRPIEDLLIAANWGYIETEQSPTPGAPPGFLDAGLSPTLPLGSPFGGPKHEIGLTAQYGIGLGENIGKLTPGIDFQHQSGAQTGSIFFFSNIESASIANGHLRWDAPMGDWSVALHVTNMFDHRYFDSKFDLTGFGFHTIEGHPNRPREWAVTVRKEF